MTIYAKLTEACEYVEQTSMCKEIDSMKWANYMILNSADQLDWRRKHGHREFCRLQRLSFHAFI